MVVDICDDEADDELPSFSLSPVVKAEPTETELGLHPLSEDEPNQSEAEQSEQSEGDKQDQFLPSGAVASPTSSASEPEQEKEDEQQDGDTRLIISMTQEEFDRGNQQAKLIKQRLEELNQQAQQESAQQESAQQEAAQAAYQARMYREKFAPNRGRNPDGSFSMKM